MRGVSKNVLKKEAISKLAITVDGYDGVSVEAIGQYQVLPLSSLIIPSYQRNPKPKHIHRISNNFDAAILGTLLVNRRTDGTYAIIDGQTRKKALDILKRKYVLCQVLDGLTIEQEADKYVKLNTQRTALNANQKFIGKLEKKDPIALNIVAVLLRHGLTYTTESGTKEQNRVACVASLEHIYKSIGGHEFDNLVFVNTSAYSGSPNSLHVQMWRGLATFIRLHTEYYDRYLLIEALRKEDPQVLLHEAMSIARDKEIYRLRYDSGCVHVAKHIWAKYENLAKVEGKKGIPWGF